MRKCPHWAEGLDALLGALPGADYARLALLLIPIGFGAIINLRLQEGKKINPCIGAAGVSAVPMSARVVQQFVSDETNGKVIPLMSTMVPNVAGVIGSAMAAGVFLTMFG
jgi:oxaloacetate decarboxylase beta subunit